MHYDKENFAITFNVLNALDQIWYFLKHHFSMAFQVVHYIMPKRKKYLICHDSFPERSYYRHCDRFFDKGNLIKISNTCKSHFDFELYVSKS